MQYQLYTIVKQPIYSRLNIKNADIICYILTSLVYLLQDNVKKKIKNLIKINNIDEENIHIL